MGSFFFKIFYLFFKIPHRFVGIFNYLYVNVKGRKLKEERRTSVLYFRGISVV